MSVYIDDTDEWILLRKTKQGRSEREKEWEQVTFSHSKNTFGSTGVEPVAAPAKLAA
jgi:hypothetical protein